MKITALLFTILMTASGMASAGDSNLNTAVGGGVGAAAGTAIGSVVGGKTGEIVGGAVGGGLGGAVTTKGEGQAGAVIGGAAGGAGGAYVGRKVSGSATGAVVGATLSSNFPAGATITGATSQGSYYFVTTSQPPTGNITQNANITITLSGTLTNTNFLYFTQVSWVALGATVGQAVSDAKFPAGTRVQTISALQSFGGTNYYKITFTQTSNGAIAAAATVTFTFGQPPYALPGETVFSFIATPGSSAALDLSSLKELTNTTLGGRGTYPNGPDVLAINVYKVSGTAIPANLVLRWGEAQA